MGSQVRVLYRAPHVKVPESLRFRGFRYFDELGVWKNLPNHLKSYKNCRSLTAKKQAALIYWAACFCISGCLKIRPAHEIIQRHTVYIGKAARPSYVTAIEAAQSLCLYVVFAGCVMVRIIICKCNCILSNKWGAVQITRCPFYPRRAGKTHREKIFAPCLPKYLRSVRILYHTRKTAKLYHLPT